MNCKNCDEPMQRTELFTSVEWDCVDEHCANITDIYLCRLRVTMKHVCETAGQKVRVNQLELDERFHLRCFGEATERTHKLVYECEQKGSLQIPVIRTCFKGLRPITRGRFVYDTEDSSGLYWPF